MRQFGDKQYVVFKPSVRVLNEKDEEVPSEVARLVKQSVLSNQYNGPFNDAVDKWRRLLFENSKDPLVSFLFPDTGSSSCRFLIRRSPVFAQIGQERGGRSVTISENHRPLIKQEGFELSEPRLVFCNKHGTATVTDTHPIRGVVKNRPYDYPLTQKGLAPYLRIGVICPDPEAANLRAYLQEIHQSHRPATPERDYLIDYPGFQQAYGLPIEIPDPGTPGWIPLTEPSGNSQRATAVSLAHQITRAIENLRSSYAPHVILVFSPQRWEHLRGNYDKRERFDVHDFVKAYAVQHGIATQFLTQDTLSDSQRCRVWWWLSLALYVKGMRTPWVLDGLDNDAAYVGLGFSMDRTAKKGTQVVLGCSHIYSSHGEGLQYRLSKIENPLIRWKNPFMSKDDARHAGETIRQLFWEAHMKLPSRVVLHKRNTVLEARTGRAARWP